MRHIRIEGKYSGPGIEGADVKVFDVATGNDMADVQSFSLAHSVDDVCLVADLVRIDFEESARFSPDSRNQVLIELTERVIVDAINISPEG